MARSTTSDPKTKPGARRKSSAAATAPATPRLIPPPGGATVRMYRTGHGDCFLLAFPTDDPAEPAYVLIDCGYKPGSPDMIAATPPVPKRPAAIAKHIFDSTGGRLTVAVVTHEHQDHVNAITAKHFGSFDIKESWFAWTEDPHDDVAEALRDKFKDQLIGLAKARNQLAADGDTQRVRRLDEFLAFELGGDEDEPFGQATALAAAANPSASFNKRSMALLKTKAQTVRYLRPHDGVNRVPGVGKLRVFAFGPPRDTDLLNDLDPRENERFGLSGRTPIGSFLTAGLAVAASSGDGALPRRPFTQRYSVSWDSAFVHAEPKIEEFFTTRYGNTTDDPNATASGDEVPGSAEWRRIDKDWLYAADQLAIDLNSKTNNSSLVLAFELGAGGKVLLFAADAQRGNWASWATSDWHVGDEATVTARDLLGRTVLYKVGHHGSHNATLNGRAADATANLGWMASGPYGSEFAAMITAVRAWAETQNGWDHPEKAIKDALLAKAEGRVFQTDQDITDLLAQAQARGNGRSYTSFRDRVDGGPLYFDLKIHGDL